jgi:hypothetical protein
MQLQKIFSFLLIFTFYAVISHAQQFKERVYLKDSVTFYEGYIIEQAPARYVKIYRLVEKDTITAQLSDVLKITKLYVIDTIVTKKAILKPIKQTYTKVAFVELLGAAGLYSINYDMRTAKGRRDGWGFRVGYERIVASITDSSTLSASSVATIETNEIKFTAIPIVLNYLFGKKKDFLELGVGATYFKFNGKTTGVASVETYQIEVFKEKFSYIFGTFNVGYRHVPYKAGFMYRVAFTPLLISDTFIPFFGLGLGYHFK